MKLSQRVQQLVESATLAVGARAARMKAEGIDVVTFGTGEPDFDTPQHIRRACAAALEAGYTRYPTPASGLAAAKKAVCTSFARHNGLNYKPEQIIITNGGKLALALAMLSVLDPGDEVAIAAPYWVSYPDIAKLADGVPVFVAGPEENDYRLRPRDLESALTPRTRIVCLNSPSNPSGVTYTPDEIRALAAVLTKHNILVISDEIYDRLLFDGQKTLSYAAVSDAAYAQTLTVNSASKTYAMTGWRIAYAGGPKDLIDAMAKIQSQTTSGAATFSQMALVEALTADQGEVERMRLEFERRAKFMWQRLTAIPGIRCPRPTGAFFCFPNVSPFYKKLGVAGSGEFASRLLEEARVAVVPGAPFGLDAHVRLSFATSMEQINEGLDRIERFLR